MSKAKDKKKEHYVSQAYLRRFAHDGKKVFVFDKIANKTFETNIRNVACEMYFYDFPQTIADNNMDPQMVENILQNLDADFSSTIEDVLQTAGKGAIGHDQKLKMAFFITNQLLRTRKFRDFHVKLAEETLSDMLKIVLAFKAKYGGLNLRFPLEEYGIEYNEKMAPVDQAKSMFSPTTSEIAEVLYNHIWIVGINQTAKPFYTSDSPVVWDTHKEYPLCRGYGLTSEGIEVAFPLSPKHILILLERTFFRDCEELDCKCIALSSDKVMYYNGFQVFESYRQLYCSSNDFSFAEEICDKFPQACSPKGQKTA